MKGQDTYGTELKPIYCVFIHSPSYFAYSLIPAYHNIPVPCGHDVWLEENIKNEEEEQDGRHAILWAYGSK